MTKRYRKAYWLLLVLSLFCNVFPLAFYTLKAVLSADLTHEKVSLSMTVLVVIILTAVSLVNRIELRSRLWILLIGIYLCLDSIMTPLVIIAACQIVDELLICPMKKSAKNKLIINKQIDRRM